MRLFISRLRQHPLLAFEIFASTFFITVLNLALPLYVILLLRKYLTSGFQGTLITLTVGVLLVIVLQAAFKFLRTKMALALNTRANENLARNYLQTLLQARAEAVEQLPAEFIQAVPGKLQNVQNVYTGPTLTALLDAPFSLLYLLAVFLLSPILGAISLLFCVLLLALGIYNIHASQKEMQELNNKVAIHNRDILAAVQGVDTARLFGGEEHFLCKWDQELPAVNRVRERMHEKQDVHQNFSQSGSMFMSVGLYALGAPLVITGNLNVATLIGANILASRGYQNFVRAIQSGYLLKKASRALNELEILRKLPTHSKTGTALSQLKGSIYLRDIGYTYPRSGRPVFQNVHLRVDPGQILVISGPSGSGKSTLAKLLAGLVNPVQGEILVDGVNLKQISLKWWRQQLIYLPEEFSFTAGSIRENIILPRPEIEDKEFNQILRLTGLRPILDAMPQGLETVMTHEGREFPPGTRKKIALARALTTGGCLVLMDEPDSDLDHLARNDLYALMNHLHGNRQTIIVLSNDPKIIKAAHVHYSLDSGPGEAQGKA